MEFYSMKYKYIEDRTDCYMMLITGVLPVKVNEQMIDFRADYDMIDMSSRRMITGCYYCTRINNLFIVKEQYNE